MAAPKKSAPKKTNSSLSRTTKPTKDVFNPADPKRPAQKPSGKLTAPKQNANQRMMTAGISYASAVKQVKDLQKAVANSKKWERDPEGMRGVFADMLTNSQSDASKSKRNYENLSSKASASKYKR